MKLLINRVLAVATLGFLLITSSSCGSSNSSKPSALLNFEQQYSFGGSLTSEGEAKKPVVRPNGNVYALVSGSTSYQLVKFANFGKGAVTYLTFPANYPIAQYFAISPVNGNVYGDEGKGIVELSQTLQFVATFQEPQTGTYWHGNNSISGIAIDSQGNVYEADGYNIVKFDANGNYLTTIPVFDAGLGNAGSLTVDSNDNLYTGNFTTITKFNATGKMLELFSCYSQGQAATANGSIAVDGAGNIYAASSANAIVGRFTADGRLTALSQNSVGTAIAVDPSGNVYSAFGGAINVSRVTSP